MLLLSSPQSGLRRRASLLLLAAVLLCVVPVGASLPAYTRCPSRIDCAQQRRLPCKPNTSHCGSCLSHFQENEDGHCELRRLVQHEKETSYLDDEIDYLRSIIAKQEISKMKTTKKQFKHPDVKNSQTEASNNRLRNQGIRLDQILHNTTAAPQPAVTTLPNTPTSQPRITGVDGRGGPIAVPAPGDDSIIVILISVCVVVGTVAVILATVCYIKLQRDSRLAEKVDYPAFGGAGVPAAKANGASMGDKTLAQSAQMYHYQHQKQQMLSLGNNKPEQKAHDTEITSDEEEVGGDFTVYECPGLAPTGEMEVKNPLFDDSTIHYQKNHK